MYICVSFSGYPRGGSRGAEGKEDPAIGAGSHHCRETSAKLESSESEH